MLLQKKKYHYITGKAGEEFTESVKNTAKFAEQRLYSKQYFFFGILTSFKHLHNSRSMLTSRDDGTDRGGDLPVPPIRTNRYKCVCGSSNSCEVGVFRFCPTCLLSCRLKQSCTEICLPVRPWESFSPGSFHPSSSLLHRLLMHLPVCYQHLFPLSVCVKKLVWLEGSRAVIWRRLGTQWEKQTHSPRTPPCHYHEATRWWLWLDSVCLAHDTLPAYLTLAKICRTSAMLKKISKCENVILRSSTTWVKKHMGITEQIIV